MLWILSVAQGTVEVGMCGKVFSVRIGGMWRLRGGEQCSLGNCGVEGAVVPVWSSKREWTELLSGL
jgi:hypothetical protein